MIEESLSKAMARGGDPGYVLVINIKTRFTAYPMKPHGISPPGNFGFRRPDLQHIR